MRDKIYTILNKLYAIIMLSAFFAGVIPLIPFVIAIIVGGSMGETIALFLQKQFYPWVFMAASVAILIGTIAMYVGKKDGSTANK